MATLPSSADLTADGSGSRYELIVKIASGGMATVYVGQIKGSAGFRRLVAIKRAHAHLIENPSFKQMLVDEARLASRLHHPNVVAVLDVEELAGELRLVMDYVEGASLSELMAQSRKAERRLPARVAVRIALDACAGLHAAHELCDEDGKHLGLVHRDVSPHNILVGIDGVARLSDFGIAKQAEGGVSTTTGALKGKLGYMAPEYVEENRLDARSDVFALGAVTWEALANQRLFQGSNEVDTLKRIVAAKVPPLSSEAPWVGKRLDAVLAAALARVPDERFASAQAFGTALETAARRDDLIATPTEVGAYVRELCAPALDKRRALVRERTAPHRSEPTVRVTRPPSEPAPAPVEAAPASQAVDRPTVPDQPPRYDDPAPAAVEPAPEVAREASSITLQNTASLASRSAPPTRRSAVLLGAAALALGAIAALALRWPAPAAPAGSAAPAVPAPPSAPAGPVPAASATAGPVPASSAVAAPSATASATPGASARPAGRLRPAAKTTAAPEGALPINPYARP
jgi:serine/threonine-protein kinase